MRTMVVTILIAGALTACGTAARTDWVYARPGISAAERQRDEQACRMSAVGTADVNPLPTWAQTLDREAFNECMRARGYDVRLGQVRR